MHELSMCTQRKCPKRGTCFRYRAMPCLRQSYFIPDVSPDCSYYLPVEEGDAVRPTAQVDELLKGGST